MNMQHITAPIPESSPLCNAEVSCMTESEYTLLFLSTEASLPQRCSCQLHRDVRRDPFSPAQTVHIPSLKYLTAIV